MTGKFTEGTFRIVSQDGEVSWYQVEMTRYPHIAWWITNRSEVNGTLDKITRRRLSDRAWAKLETWL